MLKTGCLFVALAVFSDGSPIDKQMKHSEHLPVFADNVKLNVRRKKKVDGWQLVSLLPDIEVSDLEKQMNNKLSGDDLSLCRLKLYHSVTGFLLSPFEERSKQVIRYLDSWSWYGKSLFPDLNDHW